MSKEKLSITIESAPKRRRVAPRTAFKAGEENPHAFRKGRSGNPGGRPKNDKRLISRALRVQLQDRAPDSIAAGLKLEPGASWGQAIARSLMIKAVRGDVQAARTILDYVEPQTLNVGIGPMVDENGDPLPIPSLQVVFIGAPHQPHFLDRETPPSLSPPIDCKIE